MQMLEDAISPEELDKRRRMDACVETRKLGSMGEMMAQAEGNRHERRAAEALASKVKEFAR